MAACFWLPSAYSAAAAPIAAIFAILSKVGIYVIWRLSLLLFGLDTGPSAGLAQNWLVVGGLATLIFGSIGVLASQSLVAPGRLFGHRFVGNHARRHRRRAVSRSPPEHSIIWSARPWRSARLFMLVELIDRGRMAGADVLAVTMEAYGDFEEDELVEDEEVGIPIPGKLAVLGISFIACGLLIVGLPPFSGLHRQIRDHWPASSVRRRSPGRHFRLATGRSSRC